MAAKILITGGGGFLGQALLRKIRHRDNVLVRLERTMRSDASSNVYTSVDDVFKSHPAFDLIYHLAAYIPENSVDVSLLDSVNIGLTKRLTELYPNARFVFASSVSVYGVPEILPISVNSRFINPGAYGRSKIDAENCIRQTESYAIIRFSSIVGVGMTRITFVNRVIADAKSGSIIIWGDGGRKQNYIDVQDAAQMLIAAALSPDNIIINGVAPKSWSNIEIARLVSRLTNSPVEFKGQDDSPSFEYEIGDSYKNINFTPTMGLEQTIQEMLTHG